MENIRFNFSSTRDACRKPSQFKGRIIFMSMCNDVNWWQNENEDVCRQNAMQVSSYAKDFEPGRWSFLGLGDEEKWCGSLIDKPLEKWSSTAEMAMQEFAKSGHPVFRSSSPLSRCLLKSKGGKQYTYRAHVFLMHSCTVILSLISRSNLSHHAWLKSYGANCQCLATKHSHFTVQCRTSRLT